MFELELAEIVGDASIESALGEKAEMLCAGRGRRQKLLERLERGVVGWV